jgi:hypothetical protein
MHRHEMQQSNIYLGIYIIEYYFFWKIRVLHGPTQSRWASQSGYKAHLQSRGAVANARRGDTGGGSAAPAMPATRGCGEGTPGSTVG